MRRSRERYREVSGGLWVRPGPASGGDCPALSLGPGAEVNEFTYQRPKLFSIWGLLAHSIPRKALPGVDFGPLIAATNLRLGLVTANTNDSDRAGSIFSRR